MTFEKILFHKKRKLWGQYLWGLDNKVVISYKTYFAKGGNQFQECLMKCHRCGSLMVYERFYGPHEHFLGWRCVLCGEIVDQVILENRQANPGGQKSARRDEGNSWWNETSSEMRGAEGNGIGILEIFLIDALLSGIYRYIWCEFFLRGFQFLTYYLTTAPC